MNHSKIKPIIASLVIMLLSFSSVRAQVQKAHYNTYVSTYCNGFYDYLPQGYSSTGTTLYPLLIFVHGSWENGSGNSTDLPKVLKHGPPKLINEGTFPTSFTVNSKTFKFIVFSPQFKSNAGPTSINAVIDYAVNHYKVDRNRIYLTGLSSGGGSVESAAADAIVGKRLAAVVEFAGTSSPSITRATTIVNNKVAFWGLHSQYDNVVSSSKTIGWVNDILEVNSSFPTRKTIVAGSTNHNCWTTRYPASWTQNGLNIYQWMLQYSRGTSSAVTTYAVPGKVEAENYVKMQGVQTQTTSDAGGGKNVGYIDYGDWMDYSVKTSASGSYTIGFRVATPYTGAQLQVKNSSGTILTTVTVPNTGGWQTWKTVYATVKLVSGTQTLRVYSSKSVGWNLNYMNFTTSTTADAVMAANAGNTDSNAAEKATALSIAPNPISDRFVLRVNNPYTGTMKVQLIDLSGVVRKEFQVLKNVTGGLQTYLSAGTLTPGTYIVKTQLGTWTQSTQVVKL